MVNMRGAYSPLRCTACNLCGRTVRNCGNTTNLVKHLRLNHNTEYNEVMQQESEEEEEEEEEEKGAARARWT